MRLTFPTLSYPSQVRDLSSPEDARECPLGALEERALDPERLELVVRRLGAAVVRPVVLEAVDAHPLARLADLGRDEVPLHRARVVLARRQRLHAAYLGEFFNIVRYVCNFVNELLLNICLTQCENIAKHDPSRNRQRRCANAGGNRNHVLTIRIYRTWTNCPSRVLSDLSGCVLEGRICAPGNSSAMRCVNAGSFSNSSPRYTNSLF